MERRLAAILAADVVGYSRLMEGDEEATLLTLNAYREVIDRLVAARRGRVFGSAGDSVIAEFVSPVEAVRCAVEIQQEIEARNTNLPEDRRMRFRIGVNLGDVMAEGDNLFGDGVNIAARLEGLCEGGGVALSGNVHEQVQGKLDQRFKDAGEHEVKNIARPIRVWRWSEAGSAGPTVTGSEPLPLPDKPSIAVLAFDNLSGDPEQEYLADGITEDIITALSKFRWFFVTARNSTFTYKGSAVDIKRVGKELGVRFVLEGSVRKVGNRVRVSAQLIEAATGNHIWAERYDRQLDNIFALQDEITRTIASAVEPELSGFERDIAMQKPTENLGAWDFFQRGVAKLWRTDRSSGEESRALLQQAVAMDPDFGRAYGYLAFATYELLVFGWAEDREASLRQGITDARKAISMDSRDYFAHFSLGRLHTLAGDHTAAIRALETSVDINPNFAHGYYGLAAAQSYVGDAENTIKNADLAIRLSPNDPLMWAFLIYKGYAHFCLDDLDQAIEWAERACQFPTAQFIPFAWLTAMYVHAGRKQDASKALESARRLEPNLSIAYVKGILRTAQGVGIERLYDGLRKAGLPE
jgi:adenylate cyclase